MRHLSYGFIFSFLGIAGLAMPCSAAIDRVSVADIDASSNTSSTVDFDYHSGSSGSDRYAIFVIQLANTTADAVTGVTYGGTPATLLLKRQSTNSQGNRYNYIYGLSSPSTGTSTVAVAGSETIAGYVTAVTYAGVGAAQPDVTHGFAVGSLSSWTIGVETTYAGEVVVAASGDENGSLAAGADTEKLSTTRSSGGGLQVWQGGPFTTSGVNNITLDGSNGGGTDIAYVSLMAVPETIVRGTVADVDMRNSASTTIAFNYDSGSSGSNRYAVFVIQIANTTADAVTSVTYGGTPATLLKKRQSTNSQGNRYNYIYGLPNPSTGTSTVQITASATIAPLILAATYAGVEGDQPDVDGGAGVGTQSSWTINLTTTYAGEVVVAAHGDENGLMAAGSNTTKLSTTRAAGDGLQVWQGGAYASSGSNNFSLVGANGGGADVMYVALKPYAVTPTITRGNVTDMDATGNASSTISFGYNSGATSTNRYAVFVIQLANTTADAVTGVSYGGTAATLLTKRQSTNSQGNRYNYIYGLAAPVTGTSTVQITGSQTIAAYAVAATYQRVDASQPETTGGEATGSESSWTVDAETADPGEVVIIASGDENGSFVAGADTVKLSSTRASGGGLQVWQGGVYAASGTNEFTLVGANGGGADVAYVALNPS